MILWRGNKCLTLSSLRCFAMYANTVNRPLGLLRILWSTAFLYFSFLKQCKNIQWRVNSIINLGIIFLKEGAFQMSRNNEITFVTLWLEIWPGPWPLARNFLLPYNFLSLEFFHSFKLFFFPPSCFFGISSFQCFICQFPIAVLQTGKYPLCDVFNMLLMISV